MDLDPQQVQAFIQSPYQDSTYQNKAIELGERYIGRTGDSLCKEVEAFLITTQYTGYHRKGGRTRRR